jgi:ribosome-associated toxin RatA of RatAB toxin-antitoxin module
MPSLTLTKQVAATPEVVFDTITDHASYPSFTPIRRCELEREGDEAPNGVNAIRALHVAGPPIRERVTAYERPGKFSYEVLSGIPVKSQVGTVSIEPAGRAGSTVSYALEIEPLIPFSGPVVGFVTKQAIGRLLDGVAGEAERRARSATPATASV